MSGLITWILILCIIIGYRKSQSQRNNLEKRMDMGENSYTNNKPIQHQPIQNQSPKNAQQQYNQPKQPIEQKASESASTMAYLDEKARQDAVEHAREKREETMRLNKNYGGLRVAERRYEGSSIPNGKKCIACAYCGAENLIPAMPRERYSCYFCREAL